MRLQTGRTDDVIAQLRDSVVILHLEAQSMFSLEYEDYSWQASFGEPAGFFFNRNPPAMFHPHVIGTVTGGSHTWMWAWDNATDFPEEVFSLSRKIREIGESLEFLPFLAPRHKAGDGPIDEEWKTLPYAGPEYSVPADFMFAAMAIGDFSTPLIYGGPAGDSGSVIWFVLENEDEFSLAPATVPTSMAAITEALRSGLLTDHRAGLRAYAKKREGVSISETASQAKLTFADGQIDIAFDQAGLIKTLEAATSLNNKESVSRPSFFAVAGGMDTRSVASAPRISAEFRGEY